MKDKLDVSDIAILGIILAVMIVCGKVLYQVSTALPIPSSRVLLTTPVWAFVMTIVALRIRKIGVVSLLSIAYGIYLLRYSPFSMLSVALSGILCDIVTKIFFKNYDKNRNICLSIPLKNFFSVWTSFFVVNIFVPSSKFTQAAIIPTLIVAIIIYIIGFLVSKYTIKIFSRRVSWATDRSVHAY